VSRPFHIRQIYLKDLSFQAPLGAAIFTQEWQPQIKVDMKTQHEAIPGNLTEVVLTMSIVATSAARTAFMIEVIQAGIFQIGETSGPAFERIVGALCPEALLPYAREAIDSTLMKGRFPPLIIDPIDFEASLASR
jgi:preprotein translocase subunit SecB